MARLELGAHSAPVDATLPVSTDPLVWGMLLAALVDAADLYFRLIRRRAARRRVTREDDEAMLRSMVRVLLAD